MSETGITIIPPQGIYAGPIWQPIETAPMDGREIILYYEHYTDDGFVTAGYFTKGGDGVGYWYSDLVNGYASPPTQWMPLPTKPG